MKDTLTIKNFAQIAEVSLELGDLTVLVGAQGTGKSLALQWLKVAMDGRQVVEALRAAGHETGKEHVLVDLIFGAGMGDAWRRWSSVTWRGKKVMPQGLARVGKGVERVFFVPAHRSMLISDGWAAPFQRLTPETPVVARIFSQRLFERFSNRESAQLFPLDRVLRREYVDKIDAAVFHGGHVRIEEDQHHAKRLRLIHGSMHLPFMTWTAGQREFTPLLLGLHDLLPSRQPAKPRQQKKLADVEWVIIEEPEMGLHPQAITVVMLLVLDLLWRGYRVVLSTHSPHVLTTLWMLRRLQESGARWQSVCEAFDVPSSQVMSGVARAALDKEYRAHLLAFEADGKVRSTDISELDPMSEDERIAGWGGLTEFSSRFGEVVRRAVNEGGR